MGGGMDGVTDAYGFREGEGVRDVGQEVEVVVGCTTICLGAVHALRLVHGFLACWGVGHKIPCLICTLSARIFHDGLTSVQKWKCIHYASDSPLCTPPVALAKVFVSGLPWQALSVDN